MKRFTVSKVASHSSSSLFAHGVEAAAGTAEARDAEREEDEDGDPDDGGQEPAVEGAGRCRCVEDVARADVAVLRSVFIIQLPSLILSNSGVVAHASLVYVRV